MMNFLLPLTIAQRKPLRPFRSKFSWLLPCPNLQPSFWKDMGMESSKKHLQGQPVNG